MALVVLIVNKDCVSAEHCSEALNRHGCNTVIAHSPETALSLFRSSAPDLLLLDAVMALDPEPPDIAATIAAEPALHRVPLILTVGLAHPPAFPFEQQARERGLPVVATLSVASPASELFAAVERACHPTRPPMTR